MKTLLLLRGVPGSGKSTFVKENHLEQYTLCADDFRLKISNPVLNESGRFEINQQQDGLTWKLLFDALEIRMKHGDFTIIDATHCSPTMTKKYKPLVEKYRYTVYYLDIDVSLETALSQNASRDEYKQVPEKVIRRMYAMFHGVKPQSYIKKIDKIDDILNYFTADCNEYDKVKIIGDVHGCYTVLNQALGELDPSVKYVFCGDMLERGLENKEVLEFVLEHANDKNVTFVMGNHDEYWLKWVYNLWEPDKHGKFRRPPTFDHLVENCLNQFDSESDELAFRKRIKLAINRFRQCYAFEFNGNKYFVCHGGIPSLPKMTLVSTRQLIKGVGGYEFDVDKAYEENYEQGRTQGFTQIHGHRLASTYNPETYNGTEHSINLEGGVERGGFLKVCTIAKTGIAITRYQNLVFDQHVADEQNSRREAAVTKSIETENEDVNKIIQDKYVKVKDLDDHNLISLNFTDKAFYKKKWNENTIKARGLFVDKTTGQIKLRSYNKFFNLNERPDTQAKALEHNLEFPLKVYRKQNGFLGIMSVVDDDVVLASKTTTHSRYSGMFKKVYQTLPKRLRNKLAEIAERDNCSFVFEVCHVDDKHIIDFDRNHLWLLDAISNTFEIGGIDVNEKFSDEKKEEISDSIDIDAIDNFAFKKLLFECNSLDEVIEYSKEHKHDRTIEGVVCQDRRGYMFKLKFHYYNVMKKLRGSLFLAQRKYSNGIPWGAFQDERTVNFISYFVNKPYQEWRDIHIIDAIKQYERNCGLLMDLD